MSAHDVIEVQSYIEGPRWAFGPSFLYDGAIRCGIEIVNLQEHKGLLHKTITYKLRGERWRVEAFGRAMKKIVNGYNG